MGDMSDTLWAIVGIAAYIYVVLLLAACVGRGMDE